VFHQKYTWVPHEKQVNFYVTKRNVYAVSFKSRSYRVNKHRYTLDGEIGEIKNDAPCKKNVLKIIRKIIMKDLACQSSLDVGCPKQPQGWAVISLMPWHYSWTNWTYTIH
jgi:hypothetical protein